LNVADKSWHRTLAVGQQGIHLQEKSHHHMLNRH
jgi:hypothetical protein